MGSKTRRIGPKMFAAVRVLHAASGAVGAALDLAEAVGPHGSRNFGYKIVDRVVRAGLATIDPQHPAAAGRRGNGAIVLTDTGRALLA